MMNRPKPQEKEGKTRTGAVILGLLASVLLILKWIGVIP